MKKLLSISYLLFIAALANAQCPCCDPVAAGQLYQEMASCPPGQTGSNTILWFCVYGGAQGGNNPGLGCNTNCDPADYALQTQQFLGVVSNCFLPVELKSFTGKINVNVIELEWKTASEKNNDYFMLERSFDGINFNEVGKVRGAGDSDEEVVYSYNDQTAIRKAKSNTAYYRLRQVDVNGMSEYSPVILFNLSSVVAQFEINSVSNNANNLVVNYHSESENEIGVMVYDVQGRVVYNGTANSLPGFNETSIQLPAKLASGLYVVTLTNGSEIAAEKVLVD